MIAGPNSTVPSGMGFQVTRPLGLGLSAMIPAYAGAVSPAGTALPLSMVVGVRGDSLLSGNSAGTRQAMADKISAQARSKMMAGIRAKNTRPEMIVRRYLHSQGFRYRLHRKDLPGSPDVLLPRFKAVVFVHGCFWHGHEGCQYFKLPDTRRHFWELKIAGNARRDEAAISKLADAGWRVAIVWECALRTMQNQALEDLRSFITSSERRIVIGSPKSYRSASSKAPAI